MHEEQAKRLQGTGISDECAHGKGGELRSISTDGHGVASDQLCDKYLTIAMAADGAHASLGQDPKKRSLEQVGEDESAPQTPKKRVTMEVGTPPPVKGKAMAKPKYCIRATQASLAMLAHSLATTRRQWQRAIANFVML